MEKLLKLLNEYEFKVADTYNYAEREATEYDLERLSERIISKKYGFIKWLVDNDKIDLKKLDEVERKPMYVTNDMFSLYKVDECVIMLCSITDNPIEDLISYLK